MESSPRGETTLTARQMYPQVQPTWLRSHPGRIKHSHFVPSALKAIGPVVAWGAGTGSDTLFSLGQSIVPSGLSNVVAIAAGGYRSLALRTDGTIVGWGDNYFGQGVAPPGVSNVTAIAAGP